MNIYKRLYRLEWSWNKFTRHRMVLYNTRLYDKSTVNIAGSGDKPFSPLFLNKKNREKKKF